jgi:hypothetical protein
MSSMPKYGSVQIDEWPAARSNEIEVVVEVSLSGNKLTVTKQTIGVTGGRMERVGPSKSDTYDLPLSAVST